MEIVLIAVIIFLSVLLVVREYQNKQERSELTQKLFNALMSKNAHEASMLQVTQSKKPLAEVKPEFTPQENLSDEEWQKIVDQSV